MAEDDFFRPSKESARQNALNFLRGRSSLVGEVAVAIGPSWSLDETESLLEELRGEGLVQRENTPLVRYLGIQP